MLAGQPIQAPGGPWSDVEASDVTSSATSGSPDLGSPTCAVVFTAPASGQVWVGIFGDVANTAGLGIVGWRCREGSTVGAGAIVDGSETGDGTHTDIGRIIASSSRVAAGGGRCLVTGLTPGDTYHAHTHHYISGGTTMTVRGRSVTVEAII